MDIVSQDRVFAGIESEMKKAPLLARVWRKSEQGEQVN